MKKKNAFFITSTGTELGKTFLAEKIISEFEEKIKDKFGNIEICLEEGISSSSPNKINEENKIKDIEKTKKELSSDSEIKDFLDEFEGEIEIVTKIKN